MDNKIAETPLCKLAYKYGTDKCPQVKHNYTPQYYKLFKSIRKSTKTLFEMGIGYYENIKNVDITYDPKLKRWYHRGASLKMWRDFFPKATIYGADRRAEAMFDDDRIKSFVCDQTNDEQVKNLLTNKIKSEIDIFIDDGSHAKESQVALARAALPYLKRDVIYIIEDVTYPTYIQVILREYECKVIKCSQKWKDDHLVIVKNK